MDNLNLNVILKQKSIEGIDLFFKKDNTIESNKLKEPIRLGKYLSKKREDFRQKFI